MIRLSPRLPEKPQPVREVGKFINNIIRFKTESEQHVEALYIKQKPGVLDAKRKRIVGERKSEYKKSIALFRDLTAILNPIKLKKQIGHPFHLVTPSVLPFTLSLAFLCVFQNFIGFMWFEGWHSTLIYVCHAAFFANFFAVILTWIMEVFKEEQSGAHTVEIQKGFQYAILLFILSELMLFFSFFWAYFHFTLNSNSFTGGTYVPEGLVVFFWYRIPLLNTLLLLASGLSLTIAHILLVEADKVYKLKVWANLISKFYSHLLVEKLAKRMTMSGLNTYSNLNKTLGGLVHASLFQSVLVGEEDFVGQKTIRISSNQLAILPKIALLDIRNTTESVFYSPSFWVLDTVFKGFVFLMYQAYEYTSSMFSINDSVYGAVFFSLTGLHGLHVFVGVMFLLTFVLVSLTVEYYSEQSTDWAVFGLEGYSSEKTTDVVTSQSSYNLKYFNHRIAFDGAAWYWHFVDVVWLFVFIFVYWWGFTE